MRVGIISGSQRQESNTRKVAGIVESMLHDQGAETFIVNLAKKPLPLWDDTLWQEGSELAHIWQPFKEKLTLADAFVILTPEWHGMVPSALKNFFIYCGPGELGHKPGLIIAVSAGMGGSYPINELRTSSYKNSRLCYLPEHIIIRQVEDFIGDYPTGRLEATKLMQKRLHYSLALLAQYATALQGVRTSGVVDHKQFPNGM